MSVTIITPSFNKPKYVLDAVESVFSQTLRDWTYFILENSTDSGTREKISGYLKKKNDKRVKYLEMNFSPEFREKLYVPAVLCSAVFPMSSKEYVFYLSDDDLLHKKCLEAMVKFLNENRNADACYCRGMKSRYDKKSLRWIDEGEYPFGQIYNSVNLPDGVIDGGQVLFRKSVIDKMVIKSESLDLFLIPKIKGMSYHCDGIFLNKLTSFTDILPCTYNSNLPLMVHRSTQISHWDNDHRRMIIKQRNEQKI